MGNLTAVQAQQLADCLDNISEAISDYITSCPPNTDPNLMRQLTEQQAQLLDGADTLTDYAEQLVLDDVDQQMAQISAINDNIAEKLKVLGDIQKVIDIVADAITLVEGIYTLKPGLIASSAGDIISKLGIRISW